MRRAIFDFYGFPKLQKSPVSEEAGYSKRDSKLDATQTVGT